MTNSATPAAAITEAFALKGPVVAISCLKRGHINDTFISTCSVSGGEVRYVHQRINAGIFRNVPGLMDNIGKVSEHVRLQIDARGRTQEKALTIVPTKDGAVFLSTPSGEFWRTYDYIEGTHSIDVCQNNEQAYAAARALGQFQGYLCELDVTKFIEPIPGFQNTGGRFDAFEAAVQRDNAGRVRLVGAEIEFAHRYRSLGALVSSAMRDGGVPIRMTHADPKLNNVLFDSTTGEAVAVVDLDTCMPGTVLYDFGDFVRCTSVSADEDERVLSKVNVDLALFEACSKGYLGALQAWLTDGERDRLAEAPACLAFTLGLRFLTDHINGDTYFKVHRPNQNLDRARAQFQIVRSFEAERGRVAEIVAAACRGRE